MRPAVESADERCHCGNLVARLSARGVEIRCRRCKRTHLIPWEQQGQKGRPMEKALTNRS